MVKKDNKINNDNVMKQLFWIITLLFLFLQNDFCFAQPQITTSYQNKDHKDINIILNGKVKVLKEISYSPDKSCDTISYYVDTARFRSQVMQSGLVYFVRCATDTTIYFFDSNLFLEKVENTSCYIHEWNEKLCKKNIYRLTNDNLVSETFSENGNITNKTTYKYDVNNNMILKRIYDYQSLSAEDSLEYDSNNNLIRKATYRHEFLKKPTLYTIYEYQYDSLGHLIAKIFNNAIRKFTKKDIYVYDVHGNKIEEGYCENYKGKECKYKPTQGFFYDDNSLVKSFSIGKWSPCNSSETYYQYDKNGNKIETKGYCIKEDTVLDYHYVYDYNENGQQTKEEKKVGSRSYRVGFKEYNIHITMYDDYNNITQQGYYMDNNQSVDIIRYVYAYDSFGNWIKKEEYTGEDEENLSKVKITDRIIEYY